MWQIELCAESLASTTNFGAGSYNEPRKEQERCVFCFYLLTFKDIKISFKASALKILKHHYLDNIYYDWCLQWEEKKSIIKGNVSCHIGQIPLGSFDGYEFKLTMNVMFTNVLIRC